MRYDEQKFQVIERHWFGLPILHGGDAASGITFGTTDATTLDPVVRYYPKGPIRLLKFGQLTIDALSGSAGLDRVPARLLVNGSTETDSDLIIATATEYTISSVVSFTNPVVDAGSYIGIRTATPQTDDGTAANECTTTGTVAFFIDYVREFDTAKWDRTDM